MNCKKLTTLMGSGILLVALSLSGCSSNRVSLVDQDLVSVVEQGSEKVTILWADVYQQNGQTWAYGVLKQLSRNSSSIKTHVDIQILSPDGSKCYEVISQDVYVPRNRIGKGPDWKRFRVQLPDELPQDSQIKLIVHSGSHKKTDKRS